MISPFWIAWRRPPASERRRGLKRSRRGSNIAWPPPPSLAEYIAMSARWISVSTPVPCAGWQAMPMLASTSSVRPSIENGSRRPASSWRATTLASPGRRRAGSSTPNSSPPRRATVSRSPSDCSSRCATSSSRRSPAWWPSVSLISLKWSRSISITAEATSARRPAVIACSMRSRKSVRLGSPVSASCSDWCSFAIAARPPRWTARNGSSSSSSAGSENSAASTTIGREAEQQAGGRGLEEQVVGEVAPEVDDALRERDDGRDQRAVDDEEDRRDAEDRDQVLGPERQRRARLGNVGEDAAAARPRRPRSRTARR